MPVHIEITDAAGSRERVADATTFWIGCTAECPIELEIPGCRSRLIEVRVEERGRMAVRAEPGLPFPVRSMTGNIGTRFETLLDGDVLNVGPALVKLRALGIGAAETAAEALDLAAVRGPGAPVGSWYETFMQVADHLEALRDPAEMVDAAIGAVLGATSADRVHVRLDSAPGGAGRVAYFKTRDGDTVAFGVSSSLIDRARDLGRAVHVPIAAADPIASRFTSVRREGISSGIALPLSALGRSVGVLYADCVREAAVLTAEDLQRVAFIARLLAQALGNRDLVATLVRSEPSGDAAAHPALVSSSPACADMIERVKLYAPTDYTVLLRGETGTGKEVLARCVHDLSRRRAGPFVPVNCAAIPEQLMESMLFGHEKGAFTGAMDKRRGHFEEAHGGALLLDEIGDMALDLQAKILRVLQDRVVTPIGSSRQVKVDVRILAATHQDLEQMVEERRFREDLYYRLRELEIVLPPLRQRSEDVLMLAQRFLAEAARDLDLPKVPELAADALVELRRRPWRGNIRELRHIVKAAALRSSGGIVRLEHLDAGPMAAAAPSAPGASDGPSTWKERLDAQERAALEDSLRRAGGNLTKASRLFGVPRTTYREKLVKAGLLKADDDRDGDD